MFRKILVTVDTGFESRQRQEPFSSPKHPDCPPPPTLIYSRYRPGLEVCHSPESSDEVRNEWSYTSPHICVYGVDRGDLACEGRRSMEPGFPLGMICWSLPNSKVGSRMSGAPLFPHIC